MRISTSMLNGNAVSAILQDQSNLSNTQQQLASGLKITTHRTTLWAQLSCWPE